MAFLDRKQSCICSLIKDLSTGEVVAVQIRGTSTLFQMTLIEFNERTGCFLGARLDGSLSLINCRDVSVLFIGPLPSPICRVLAYVTNITGDTVTVIDTGNNTVVATIPVGTSPFSSVFSPDGTRVYVANPGSNTISVIDTATNSVLAEILAGSPTGAAITPNGRYLYVTDSVNTVSVIDTVSNVITETISVGDVPLAIAITPDGSKAFVANSGNNTVSVIDLFTNTEKTQIPVGATPDSGPIDLVISPDGTKVYVTNTTESTISVIDVASESQETVISGSINSHPQGIAITPDGSRIYVADKGSERVSFFTIPGFTQTELSGFTNPSYVAITPDGTRAYVTNSDVSGFVSVIDIASNSIIGTIPAGDGAFGITIGTVCQQTN